MQRVSSLLQARRETEAVKLVEERARASDPDMTYLLAEWRLLGMHGPRNLPLAHRLLQTAAKRGHVNGAARNGVDPEPVAVTIYGFNFFDEAEAIGQARQDRRTRIRFVDVAAAAVLF